VIWPQEQSWQTLPGRPPVLLAHFADHAACHPGLTARITALLVTARWSSATGA